MTRNAIIALAAVWMFSITAAAQPFEEGTHYQAIGTPVSAPEDRVQVIEAFAYPCPACNTFHPHIKGWEARQPDHVEFKRLPIGLQRGWDLFARAYYTAEVMGLGEDAHQAVFDALHREGRTIRNFEDIAAIYTDFDVTTESFINTAQSFAVDSRMRRNRSEVQRYGIRQTPTVVVQGRWRITPGNFESFDQMLAAIDYLVDKEAQALGLNDRGGDAGEEDEAVESQAGS
jgi:protein dithiol oxidoreductase (disulfide-forming)